MSDESQQVDDRSKALQAVGSVQFADVRIESFAVRNFRGLDNCVLTLEPGLTVLVGRNNAGKSRLLRALGVALGGAVAERDDLTVDGPGVSSIDVVIAPGTTGDDRSEVFTDATARRLGDIQEIHEDPPKERFAWRTTISQSMEGNGVRSASQVLTFDVGNQSWEPITPQKNLTFEQRSLVSADLIDTKRDLVDELSRRGSPIRRVLDDLEIPALDRPILEADLKKLGSDIVAASGSLAAITKALDSLTSRIDSMGNPSIQPLPVRLEELARGVSIAMDTGPGHLPMRLHGSGSRSLASLQVQSVLYQRRMGADGPSLRPHAVSIIEEPEAHLHPQAQFELAELISEIHGQAVVSTHSSHLASSVSPRAIRMLGMQAGKLNLVDFSLEWNPTAGGPAESPDIFVMEMAKMHRMVERPFGELLFASLVVVGDGATERALLPPLVRHIFGGRAAGLCVIDPGSMNHPHAGAVIKFAKRVRMPWLLFSDSDAAGNKAASKLDKDYGLGDGSTVVWVGDGVTETATEEMFHAFDEDLCVAACAHIGRSSSDDLLTYMLGHKGVTGKLLAAELLEKRPDRQRALNEVGYWPASIANLMLALSAILGPDTQSRLESSL